MGGPRKARSRAEGFANELSQMASQYDPEVGWGETWDPVKFHQTGMKFHKSSRRSKGGYTGGSWYDPDTGAFYDASTNKTYYSSGKVIEGQPTISAGGREITPPSIYDQTGGGAGGGAGGGTEGGGETEGGGTEGGGTEGGEQVGEWIISDEDKQMLTDLFGPDFGSIMAGVLSGLPASMKVKGWKEFESAWPLIQSAYDQAMQRRAIGTAYQSLDDLKNDPTLKATAKMVTDYMANPFTYDEETIGLMRGQAADTLANQEAALGERLRSMGATQGISPDSPLFASMAQQAAMERDINQAQMERQLSLEMAKQRQADIQSAIGLGAEFGGGMGALSQSAFANIQRAQTGAAALGGENPFAGIWQSKKLMDEYNQSNQLSTWEKWAPIIAEVVGAGGKIGGSMAGGSGGGGGGGLF